MQLLFPTILKNIQNSCGEHRYYLPISFVTPIELFARELSRGYTNFSPSDAQQQQTNNLNFIP